MPITRAQLKAAAAAALGAAAVRARLLADQEEREMARLVTQVVQCQAAKLEAKFKYLADMEQVCVCVPVCLPACLSACLSVCLSVRLLACACVCVGGAALGGQVCVYG